MAAGDDRQDEVARLHELVRRERAARLKAELLLDEKTQELNDEREALAQERFLLQALMDNIPDHVYFKDRRSAIIRISRAQATLFGLSDPVEAVGKTDFDFFSPTHAQQARADELEVIRTGKTLNIEERETWFHQPDTWVSTTKVPLRNEEGTIIGTFGVSRDITEKKLAEEQLRLAASVFTHAREGIVITDPDATIIDVNDAFCAITGYRRKEVLGTNPRFLRSGLHDESFYRAMWRSLVEDGHWNGEVWNRRKDGELFAELLTISAVRDDDGRTTRYLGLFTEITAIKRHEKELEHNAHFDVLTNLPNRLLLADRMQQCMAQAVRRGRTLAVAFIDIDGFKSVNDQHGHDAGDHLLVTVSNRMRSVLREGDTLARLGGDEFVAVLLDLPNEHSGVSTLGRLLAAVAEPVDFNGVVFARSASIGVSLYPQASDLSGDQLLRQADHAMYDAKLAGKNCYRFFHRLTT
ncbi:MAG: diguanylate cyclase [Propionivibrio sp.]